MNRSKSPFLQYTFIATTVAAILGLTYLLVIFGNQGDSVPTQKCIDYKLAREKEAYKELQFNLVDPTTAPEPIRELAKIGFEAMLETKRFAPEYVGNDLSCTNCHFAGGNTTGGSQGGISLAGVATKYPRYDEAFGKVINLPDRINSCFLKSMNGKALPVDSELMLAFLTYYHWISRQLPIYGDIPWLGLNPLKSEHVGDASAGKKLYDTYCATCHHEVYRGLIYPPPLWGSGAFNEAAGMNNPSKLASFIYWNMPYGDKTPVLTEDEALDVAAYILSKPRPSYNH
jgi:thiosulfate dehydrogenase